MTEKMHITFSIGTEDKYQEYRKVFDNSLLMENYTKNPDRDILSEWVYPHLKEGNVIIASNSNGEPVGVMVYLMNGMYGGFPYLELLGVRQDSRGQGIGGKLVDYFIDLCHKAGYKKCFICVSDFNERAKKLYISKGFQPIVLIPNLLKEGVAEWTLMKEI